MKASELPNELVDRGFWWQVGGFALTCIASAIILQQFTGSGAVWYQYFEIVVIKLYWAAVAPLAGLFEGARTMFQNIRKQKEHAHNVGYSLGFDQGYEQARLDMGLPPSPEPDRNGAAAHAAPATPAEVVAPATPSARQMLDAIEQFGVAEDGVVRIPEETLAVLRFVLNGTDEAPAA